MFSLRLLLKVFDVTLERLNFTLCSVEILFALFKLFLYSNLVNLEIRILLQRGLIKSWS